MSSDAPEPDAPASTDDERVSAKLFGEWEIGEIEYTDPSMRRYITVTPIAHTMGRHSEKQFKKSEISIVERLINRLMQTDENTGKKQQATRIAREAFEIVAERTAVRLTAVLFAAVHGALVFTLGLFIALNSGDEAGSVVAKRVFRYPLVYAVALAVLARTAGVVPEAGSPLMETLGLVGEASIPIMLLILGVQLSETEYRGALSMTATPTLFRFGVSPLVGVVVATALGFQNSAVAQVFVLLTAMPVAVAPVIFVVEFASETTVGGVTLPEFVSANVFVTTLVSIPILTVVITILKSGLVV